MMGRWALEMRLCRHLRCDHQNIEPIIPRVGKPTIKVGLFSTVIFAFYLKIIFK